MPPGVTTEGVAIDLVTVFDAILTSRQTREKLQCLYENLRSNNFRRMAVLLRKLFYIRFSYKHCNFSHVCLLVKMASKAVTMSIRIRDE